MEGILHSCMGQEPKTSNTAKSLQVGHIDKGNVQYLTYVQSYVKMAYHLKQHISRNIIII